MICFTVKIVDDRAFRGQGAAVLQVGGRSYPLRKWQVARRPEDFELYLMAAIDQVKSVRLLRRALNRHEWRLQFASGGVARKRDLVPYPLHAIQAFV